MIPTTTVPAKLWPWCCLKLKGKLDGLAIRVPTPNVSIVDVVLELEKNVNVSDVNRTLKQAAEGPLSGIMGYSEKPLVSTDYIGNPSSTTIDALLTLVIDKNMIKIVSWYDNEWGYSNRVVDLAAYIASKGL